jgi:hypothetical protein
MSGVRAYRLSLDSTSAFLLSSSFTIATQPSPAVLKAAYKSHVRPYSP